MLHDSVLYKSIIDIDIDSRPKTTPVRRVCACAGALMVTMVTRVLVPDTRVGRACALAAREVDISTAIPVVWILGPIASSVTAALDMQVSLTHFSRTYPAPPADSPLPLQNFHRLSVLQ